jgi:hypothetical protein
VVLAGALIAAANDGCREPTQVTLVIDTPQVPCASLEGVALSVAGDPGEAEERVNASVYTAAPTSCESEARVGSLVITPGATRRGAVVLIAGLRRRATECNADNRYEGCVVARRAFSFLDRVALTVPVRIDPACVDIACDEGTTCEGGACVGSEVRCDEAGACEEPAADGGAPGGGSPEDGGDRDVGAPPSDAGIDGNSVDPPILPVDPTCDPRCSTDPTYMKGCRAEETCCASGGTVGCASSCLAPALTLCCVGKADCPDQSTVCCVRPGATTATCSSEEVCDPARILCRTANDCPDRPNLVCAPSGGYRICASATDI